LRLGLRGVIGIFVKLCFAFVEEAFEGVLERHFECSNVKRYND